MAGSVSSNIQAFSRLSVPDPATNAAIQDIYSKLQQLSSLLGSLQTQITQSTNPAAFFANQNVVTTSRGFGAVYQNTGTTPRLVLVTCIQTSPDYVIGYSDTSKNPVTELTRSTPVLMMVLPGNYYKVTATKVANVSIKDWVEWQ